MSSLPDDDHLLLLLLLLLLRRSGGYNLGRRAVRSCQEYVEGNQVLSLSRHAVHPQEIGAL